MTQLWKKKTAVAENGKWLHTTYYIWFIIVAIDNFYSAMLMLAENKSNSNHCATQNNEHVWA